jgi:ribonuclease P protein component
VSLSGRAARERVYREGRRIGGTAAAVVVLPSGLPGARVGLAVGRAVGGAVRRNRLRRRLREVLRRLADRLRPGYDVVVIARPQALGLPFAALVESVEEVLERAGVLGPGEESQAGERA